MNSVIYPIKEIGVMTIYEREDYRKERLPKYIVYRGNYALEEFRTKKQAITWAKENRNV